MISNVFTSELDKQLEKDSPLLTYILRQRGVLLCNNDINESLLSRYAIEGLAVIKKLFQDMQIPIEPFMISIDNRIRNSDPMTAFYHVFFYCSFFHQDLPDILLPLAVNKVGLLYYFKNWNLSHRKSQLSLI